METKSIFKSKTFWTGVITVIIGGASAAGDIVPPEANSIILMVVGVLNVVLRTITSTPVKV